MDKNLSTTERIVLIEEGKLTMALGDLLNSKLVEALINRVVNYGDKKFLSGVAYERERIICDLSNKIQ